MAEKKGFGARILDWIEKVGNKLPDPAVIFVIALVGVWIASWLMAGREFTVPSAEGEQVKTIANQLAPSAMAAFFSDMVKTFVNFHPLGVVLVALLGVGVAETSGYINAGLKALLSFTPKLLLTPMLIFVAILSHTAADAGYVLVIPLGGVIFYAAGRHPLAGIAAAFAGVSGGFSANPIVSAIDPLLAGITQVGAQLYDPVREVNPLSNWYFTAISSVLIVALGWFITDKIIEPRLKKIQVDGNPDEMPKMDPMDAPEKNGLIAGTIAMVIGIVVLVALAWPDSSVLRAEDGKLTSFTAPLMKMIVPLIFVLFFIPGVVHGYISKTFTSHRDVIQGMSKTMSTMGYYIVMAFFASLFIYSFGKSEMGALIAVEGADFLQSLGLGGPVTLFGIILLCAFVNLLVGSASAKWALLAPIFVPMLMQLNLSPELTQAAYRVGDSTTNIVTPLMPYFPLVVAFSQKYVKNTGIGTLISLMLPYSITFLIAWSLFLILFWVTGVPLGIQGGYVYP